MRSVLIFASYVACSIGAALLAIGGFYFIGGNPGPTMALVPAGGIFFCAGIVGGMKLNS